MARATEWEVLNLDGDPVPGDHWRISMLGDRYQRFAEDVAEAKRDLSHAAEDSAVQSFSGLASHEYRALFGELPQQLEKLSTSYELAGKALNDYAAALGEAQHQADRAVRKGMPLHEELRRLEASLDTLAAAVDRAGAHERSLLEEGPPAPDPEQVRAAIRNAQHASRELSHTQRCIDHLKEQLAAYRQIAEEAGGKRDDAAETCALKLSDASEAGIQNQTWLDRLLDGFSWDGVVQVFKWVVSVAGIVLIFVSGPIALIISVVALAAGVAVLVDALVKAIRGEGGWGDVLLAGLDVIPVIGKIGTLVKAGRLVELTSWAVRFEQLGSSLVGWRNLAFHTFKDFGTTTLADVLNKEFDLSKVDWARNILGSGINVGGQVLKGRLKEVTGWTEVVLKGELNIDVDLQRALARLRETRYGDVVIDSALGGLQAVTRDFLNDSFFEHSGKIDESLRNIVDGLLSPGGSGFDPAAKTKQ